MLRVYEIRIKIEVLFKVFAQLRFPYFVVSVTYVIAYVASYGMML